MNKPLLDAENSTVREIGDVLRMSTHDAMAVLDRALDILANADSLDDVIAQYLRTPQFASRLRHAREGATEWMTLRQVADMISVPVDYLGTAFVHALAARERETNTVN